MNNANVIKTMLRTAVYGEAVGTPFEFKVRDAFQCTGMTGHGTHRQPAGIRYGLDANP